MPKPKKEAAPQLDLRGKFVSNDPCSTPTRCDSDRIFNYDMTKESYERLTLCENHAQGVVEKIRGARNMTKALKAAGFRS